MELIICRGQGQLLVKVHSPKQILGVGKIYVRGSKCTVLSPEMLVDY